MLISSLYIGTSNAALAIKIQKTNLEIADLRAQNQNLAIEIQTLQNKDRVYTIAQDAGLDQNQANVVSIRNDD
jgi:cell division protein FtsL